MLLWSIAPFNWIFRAFVLSHPCLYREVSQLCSGSFRHSDKCPSFPLYAVFLRRSPSSVMNKPLHTHRHQPEAFLPWPGACYLCKAHYGLKNCFLSAFLPCHRHCHGSAVHAVIRCQGQAVPLPCTHDGQRLAVVGVGHTVQITALMIRQALPSPTSVPPSTSTLILPRASGFVIPFSSV